MVENWTYDGPEWVFLQPAEDADAEGRTWCKDAINTPVDYRQDQTEPTDCPYVRGDMYEALEEKISVQAKLIEKLGYDHECCDPENCRFCIAYDEFVPEPAKGGE